MKILQKLKFKASKILKKAILDTSNLQKLFSRKFWVAENPKFPHWVSWQHWPLLQLTYFVHNQVRRNQPHIGNVLGHIGLFRYIPWGNFGLILQTLELRMRLLERPCHHCTRIKTNGPVPYSSLQIGLQWAEIQWKCITSFRKNLKFPHCGTYNWSSMAIVLHTVSKSTENISDVIEGKCWYGIFSSIQTQRGSASQDYIQFHIGRLFLVKLW